MMYDLLMARANSNRKNSLNARKQQIIKLKMRLRVFKIVQYSKIAEDHWLYNKN